ncbi:chemotaxis protein CheW [Vreelandella olivaria]|uniref:chemotaxis protein CheW n=1 Tax=Vreelandella olivaria TaxID=390919 RepID=UPI00201EDD40|nr:chemotaxis protein CheW [Halomonas olivaria]
MTDTKHHTNEPQRVVLEEALEHNAVDHTIVDVDEPCQQLVLFRLAGQRFALPGKAVKEILSGDQPVYFVPGLPPSTEGVIHLRGKVESLITLQPLLGLPTSDQRGMILLVSAGGIRSGVRIEHLDDVCDVPLSSLKPAPETLPSELRPYVSALWQPDESTATALLDADALFSAYQQGLG